MNGPFIEEKDEQDDDCTEADDSDTLLGAQPSSESLSVGKVRTSCTSESFIAWFGERLGHRLWGLLHGFDDTEVIPTPAFPKQISVEDSYPDNRTLQSLFQNLAILTKSFVRRLDLDLRVGESYVRFPRTLRLSMRNGRQVARESKSARMPVELFDSTISVERRVELIGRTVNTLSKSMVAGWASGWKIGIINIAATELIEEMPGRGIQKFIEKAKREDQIDWGVLRELPADIRVEILQRYHLSPETLEVHKSEVKLEDEMKAEGQSLDEDNGWDSDEEEIEMEDTKEPCSICGVRIFSWMTDAHARYHKSQ